MPPRLGFFRKYKRWFAGALAAALAFALYFWPARRNYYGKLGELDVRLDVPYVAGSHNPKQALDLYLPRGRSKPTPLVLFVHGGYWSALDRRMLQPLLGTHGNVGAAFARHGVGAALLGYRQYPAVKDGDESLDDLARAIRYSLESAASWGADPARVVVVGHSAGGHLVSLLALDPRILARSGVDSSRIAGFVSLDGVFDLKPVLAAFEPEQATILRNLFGPSDAALADHSSITHAHAEHPALLFVDTEDDEPVCLESFRRMRARLAEVGSPARFVELPGLGHNELIVRVGMADDPLLPTLLPFVERVRGR